MRRWGNGKHRHMTVRRGWQTPRNHRAKATLGRCIAPLPENRRMQRVLHSRSTLSPVGPLSPLSSPPGRSRLLKERGMALRPQASTSAGSPREPTRVVITADTADWLLEQDSLPNVVTSLPDISELAGSGLDARHATSSYSQWFRTTVATLVRKLRPNCVAVFYQTDVSANTNNNKYSRDNKNNSNNYYFYSCGYNTCLSHVCVHVYPSAALQLSIYVVLFDEACPNRIECFVACSPLALFLISKANAPSLSLDSVCTSHLILVFLQDKPSRHSVLRVRVPCSRMRLFPLGCHSQHQYQRLAPRHPPRHPTAPQSHAHGTAPPHRATPPRRSPMRTAPTSPRATSAAPAPKVS